VLCPVRRPTTALVWVLLKDINLALVPRSGPEISSLACHRAPRLRWLTAPLWQPLNLQIIYSYGSHMSSTQPGYRGPITVL
jgi:hypothetical protein